jgi:importin-7
MRLNCGAVVVTHARALHSTALMCCYILACCACCCIAQVVLPLLCFDEEDAELWEDDPQEFVRKGYDVMEDMFGTKTAAANFVTTLAAKKAKGHLASLMRRLAEVMTAHDTAARAAAAGGPPVTVALARQMDGAMLAVGALSDTLKNRVCRS